MGGSLSMGNLPQQAQQAPPQAAAAAAAPPAGGPAAAAAMLGAAGSMSEASLAGMARSFSELSLQSDLNRVALVGGAPGVAGPSGRLAGGAMSTGDLLALQQQQQGLGRGGGPMALRGIASTGSIWNSAQVGRTLFVGGGRLFVGGGWCAAVSDGRAKQG